MTFAEVAVEEAVGALAVHTIRTAGVTVKKGAVLSREAVEALRGAGIGRVMAARLEDGDVAENEAAGRLVAAVAGPGLRIEAPFTGRSNLFAERPGLLVLDATRIDAINAVDETITLATLPAYKPVVAGEMVATVKIIPYAVPGETLRRALAEASAPPLRIAPYRRRRIGVVSTTLPGLKPATIDKTLAVLAARLEPANATIETAVHCAHATSALRGALLRLDTGSLDLVVVFGASAIADRRDVIPAAIEAAGGAVEHLGMPVDPGNLLLVGRLGDLPVVGAPGCARSPKENGFDWVLQRLLADLPVTGRDIAGMGVGGLLMEIVSRGQPRDGGEPEDDE